MEKDVAIMAQKFRAYFLPSFFCNFAKLKSATLREMKACHEHGCSIEIKSNYCKGGTIFCPFSGTFSLI